jgi:hypothetical protein
LGVQYGGRRIAVLIPEIIKQKWYQHLLHTLHAHQLRAGLLRECGACITVMTVPWHLEPSGSSPATLATLPRHAR